MSVNQGAEAEYCLRHAELWPEMAHALRECGMQTYSIFHHPSTNQLFAYVEIEDEGRWEAVSQTEVCRRWWDFMKEIMPTHEDGSPISQTLREVFHLQAKTALVPSSDASVLGQFLPG